jgi:hypothetical protein
MAAGSAPDAALGGLYLRDTAAQIEARLVRGAGPA